MELMTPALKERFKKVGRQGYTKDPLVIAKFIARGATTMDWYATEYDSVEHICFGFVRGHFDKPEGEWGYFSLDELERCRIAPDGVKVELSVDFKEGLLSKVYPKPFPQQPRRYRLLEWWGMLKLRWNARYELWKLGLG